MARIENFTTIADYDGVTFQIKSNSGNDFVTFMRSDNSGGKAWRLGEELIPTQEEWQTKRYRFSDALDTGWEGTFSQKNMTAWLKTVNTVAKKLYICPVINAGSRTSGIFYLRNVGFFKGDELAPDEVYIIWKL